VSYPSEHMVTGRSTRRRLRARRARRRKSNELEHWGENSADEFDAMFEQARRGELVLDPARFEAAVDTSVKPLFE